MKKKTGLELSWSIYDKSKFGPEESLESSPHRVQFQSYYYLINLIIIHDNENKSKVLSCLSKSPPSISSHSNGSDWSNLAWERNFTSVSRLNFTAVRKYIR